MNEQREIIYAERERVLNGDNMRDTIYHMMNDQAEVIVDRIIPKNQEPEASDLKSSEHGTL